MIYININQIISAAAPYIIGAIGGIGTMFTTGFTKEFFDERSRVSKHKRDVARLVLKLCNEASTTTSEKLPEKWSMLIVFLQIWKVSIKT